MTASRFPGQRAARLSPSVASLLLPSLLLGCATALAQAPFREPEEYRTARLRMVERELAREGITHRAVLDAMRQVPRHVFVDPEHRARAYEDRALPIGRKQTISPPYIVAYMTQALDPQPTERVLEIGTGSGYQAAVLSRLFKEVYTIEIVESLGRQAANRLKALGYSNVRTKIGDGYQGWAEHAPFDRIIVTCSPESVPKPLVEQLREGGTMLIPLGERFQQVFYLLEKRDGELHQTRLAPTLFVPMTGLADKLRQKRPVPGPPQLVNGGFEQLTENEPDGWFWKRPPAVVSGGAPEGKIFLRLTNTDAGRPCGVIQAFEMDGAKFKGLTVSLLVHGEGLHAGANSHEMPCLLVGFGDRELRPAGDEFVGPWLGTFGWRRVTGTVSVPSDSRVAILQIGLNGGTGALSLDDVRVTPIPR